MHTRVIAGESQDMNRMLQISDTTLVGEDVSLEDTMRHVYVGHNAAFERCDLHFKITHPRNATLAKSVFHSSHIYADIPLQCADWTSCHVRNCRFHGRYLGNDFGYHPNPALPFAGVIADCDFSDAELDGCRFFGCDMSSITLPKWPCFTLLHPILSTFERIDQMEHPPPGLSWWNKIDGELYRSYEPTEVAVSYLAPALVHSLKRDVDATIDELQDFLDTCDNVLM